MTENPYQSPPAAPVAAPPVKIKVFGLLPMTRRGYLTVQTVVLRRGSGGALPRG